MESGAAGSGGQSHDSFSSASSSAVFRESVELAFHNVPFLVTVASSHEETLLVEVEAREDGARWRGEFTARYVEDITAKTGNYKRFAVFAKMLRTAVCEEHESVFVDLLTYADLEQLRQRRLAAAGGAQSAADAAGAAAVASANASSNKRYLILTYSGEFDRVHYPLPLLYDDKPDVNAMRLQIATLRRENDRLRASGGASRAHHASKENQHVGNESTAVARRLREENARLRAQLENIAGSPYASAAPPPNADARRDRELEREIRLVRKERDLLQARISTAEGELEAERKAHRRRAAKDRKDIAQLTDDLERSRASCREARALYRRTQAEADDLRKRLGRAQQSRIPGGAAPSRYGGGAPPKPKPKAKSSSSRGGGGPYRQANSAPASRTSSRRSSAASSPSGSRRTSRSPSPAPSFDPTAYVMAKREKLAEIAARRAQSLSPASSRGTSPSRRSALSDAESDGAPRRGLTRRARGTGGASTNSAGSGPLPARRPHRLDAPSAGTTRRPPVPGVSDRAKRMENREVDRIQRLSAGTAASNARKRETSPGRALKEVQKKLQEYANKGVQRAPAKAAPAAKGGSVEDVTMATSKEIADIDSRLNALQNFLRHAKGTAGN